MSSLVVQDTPNRFLLADATSTSEEGLGNQTIFQKLERDVMQMVQQFNQDLILQQKGKQQEIADAFIELEKEWRSISENIDKGNGDKNIDIEPNSQSGYGRAKAKMKTAVDLRDKKANTTTGKIQAYTKKKVVDLNGYTALSSLFPTGDKYVSIITGVATILMKATANNQKISDTLGHGIKKINEEILIDCITDLCDNQDNEKLAIIFLELYLQTVQFYLIALKWVSVSWFKRAVTSLDSCHHEAIEKILKTIDGLAARMRRECDRSIQRAIKAFLKMQASPPDQAKQQPMQLHPGAIVQEESNLLIESGTVLSDQPSPFHIYKTADILSHVEPLEQRFQGDIIAQYTQNNFLRRLEGRMLGRFRAWTTSEENEVLWIRGQVDQERPTHVAATIFEYSRRSNLPAIAYFVQRSPNFSAEATLVEMVYSILYQLTTLLPADFETNIDFSPERFEVLDGSLASLKGAIKLIKDLLQVGSICHVFVLDGLQRFKVLNTDEKRCFKMLLKILSSSTSTIDGHVHLTKVLFTTAGPSRILGDSVNVRNRLNLT